MAKSTGFEISYTIFVSNTFVSNTRLKLAKNQAKSKQNPDAELLPFENYTLSPFMLPSKTDTRYSKKCAKTHFKEIVRLIIMKIKLKMENGSHRYTININRPRH